MPRYFAAAVFAASFLVQPLYSQESRPRFEDYRVRESWAGPNAAIKITTRPERMFRTLLAEASKEPPNFAGHYRVVTWGCGSNCILGAIVDLQTGDVLQPPTSVKETIPEEHWQMCPDIFDDADPEYHRESKLLVIRCGLNWDVLQKKEAQPDVYYYVFENQGFRLIRHVRGTKPD